MIEVLVSIVILSTGIVLVLGAMQTSASALSAARNMSRAVFLCEHQLAVAALERETQGEQTLDSGSGAFNAPFEQFRWTRDVLSEGDALEGSPRARQVSISISLEGSDALDLRFTTLLAE